MSNWLIIAQSGVIWNRSQIKIYFFSDFSYNTQILDQTYVK